MTNDPNYNPANYIVLRLATGDYTLNTTLELCSHVYLDGGYDPNTWRKVNGPGVTRLRRTTQNAEGLSRTTPQVPRLVGLRGVNITNFQAG